MNPAKKRKTEEDFLLPNNSKLVTSSTLVPRFFALGPEVYEDDVSETNTPNTFAEVVDFLPAIKPRQTTGPAGFQSNPRHHVVVQHRPPSLKSQPSSRENSTIQQHNSAFPSQSKSRDESMALHPKPMFDPPSSSGDAVIPPNDDFLFSNEIEMSALEFDYGELLRTQQ